MAKRRRKEESVEPISEGQEMMVTGVHLPKRQWALLRAVAFRRSKEHGGRASVSKLVAELIALHEKDLEREAGKYLELME